MAALVKAIEQKRFKQAELLLQLGDNVNQQEKLSGKTPLLAVCFLEDENLACCITKKLLHRGADVCLEDVQGMDPLMQACKLGKEKLAQVLIESGECDFGAADNNGNTALIYSVEAGNSRITKALTEAMNIYDVRVADKANSNGETPLIRAMKLKHNACREVLVNDGKASPQARDFYLKLNAREWELYLKEKEEKENEDEAKIGNMMERIKNDHSREGLSRKQIKDYHGRSRTVSIINSRQDFTNRGRTFTRFTPDFEKIMPQEKFLGRRTKSAPLLKCENTKQLFRSVSFNFESNNAEKGFPEKKTVGLVNKAENADKGTKQNSSLIATTVRCHNNQEASVKLDGVGWQGAKNTFPKTDTQQKMILQRAIDNNGKRASCSQSQLPKLFTLMTQEATHSFRSSAKKRTPGKPCDKGRSRGAKESSRGWNSRRNSIAMQRQYLASDGRRRWSTAETSLIALGRFSSLYSRSDFKALNPDNLVMLVKTRRDSMQSTPEELVTSSKTTKRSETKAAAISPNLMKRNPDLSASFPGRYPAMYCGNKEQITSSRVKSARPRRYRRHNSDSSPSSGNKVTGLQRVLNTTPVIAEEAEE
ncbi:uncharacterized protein LOC110064553 [Orbicella faveolata]|uniref:uncharacterized protein LOC110064553 n=1 Tax=Orbicella faveolata TaxID=48498 RepID=UPI0009E5E2ED|nr:uncharacterized protein LOC110064553 [Orbicella faveolata]